MAKTDACGIPGPAHSVDIISTCYVYKNRRKWFHSWTCKNAAGKFENLFLNCFFLLILWVRGGGTNICQLFCWVSLCNANLICYATQLPGGWGGAFLYSDFLFLRPTLTNYCLHFPNSICREFTSPVGYFYYIYWKCLPVRHEKYLLPNPSVSEKKFTPPPQSKKFTPRFIFPILCQY